jgi:hypothetical protein
MTFASRDRADRALLPSGLAKIFGNNAGVPSVTGLAGPAGDRAAVRKVQPAHAARALQLALWLRRSHLHSILPREDIRRRCGRSFASLAHRLDRIYQRAIRSEEIVTVVALGVVEQFAQGQHRESLHLVHAQNLLSRG